MENNLTTPGANALVIENPTIGLLSLTVDQNDINEVLAANMEGNTMQFPKIQMPSGKILAFSVTGEDGTSKVLEEIEGVLLFQHPCNGYWEGEYTGEKQPPVCFSHDGVTGISRNTEVVKGGHCKECPMNQFGKDENGKWLAKPCKNMIRLFLLREGELFPSVLTLPPTSSPNWKSYSRTLTNVVKPIYGVVTKLKLEPAKSGTGIDYGKVLLAKVKDLQPIEAKRLRLFSNQLESQMRSQPIDSGDYYTDGDPATAGHGETATTSDQPY